MLIDLWGDANGDRLELIPSVCKVSRLAEVLDSAHGFNTFAVVNMNGALIGLVPKSMVVVLIENHRWYEQKKATNGMSIEEAFDQLSEGIARISIMKSQRSMADFSNILEMQQRKESHNI